MDASLFGHKIDTKNTAIAFEKKFLALGRNPFGTLGSEIDRF